MEQLQANVTYNAKTLNDRKLDDDEDEYIGTRWRSAVVSSKFWHELYTFAVARSTHSRPAGPKVPPIMSQKNLR